MAYESIYTGAGADIYKPEIWAAETLAIFEQRRGIRSCVHVDFRKEIAEMGDTVNTRLPQVFVANDANATGGVDDADIQAPKAENKQVVLDTNKNVTIELRDVQQGESLKDLQAEFMYPSALAILKSIEDSGIAALSHVTTGFANPATSSVLEAGVTGTPNVPAAFGLTHIASAAKSLDDNSVPDYDRCMAISPMQVLDLHTNGGDISNAILMKANETSGESALRDRHIGRLQGIDVFMLQGTLTEAAAGSGYPTLPVHVAPFWWKNAAAYVNRMLPSPPQGAGANVSVQSYDGQAIRVSIGYEIRNKRTLMSMDALWGWKVLRPEAGGVVKSRAAA